MTKEDRVALDLKHWELVEGAVARSGAVLDAEGRIVEVWRQRGHPHAKITTRDVVADHRSLTVDVTLVVDPGPAARFGVVQVEGTKRVDSGLRALDDRHRARRGIRPRHAEAGAPAAAGHSASSPACRSWRRDTIGDDGLLPVTFNLSERKRHLIGGGVSYSTIDGATLEGYWMHRNLFGHAESLQVRRLGQPHLRERQRHRPLLRSGHDVPPAGRLHARHRHHAEAFGGARVRRHL